MEELEIIDQVVEAVTITPRGLIIIGATMVILSFIWIISLGIYYRKNLFQMVVGEDGKFQWPEVILFLAVVFFVISFFGGILGLNVPHAIYATIDITIATALTGSIYTKTNSKTNT